MNLSKMGNFIAENRRKKDLTQNQLGELLGVSGKAVSKWERGRSAPDISILNELSSILEVSISEILVGENNTNNHNYNKENSLFFKSVNLYNQLFQKKIYKTILLLVSIIILISVIFITTYFTTNYNKCQLYSLSSDNDKFNLQGILARNQKQNTIILTAFNYIDPSVGTLEEIEIAFLEVSLKTSKTNLALRKYNFESKKISEALKDILLIVNEDSEFDKKLMDKNIMKDLSLEIVFKNTNNIKNKIVIPIKIEKSFSNNKLFY